MIETLFVGYPVTEKVWGKEILLINTDKYCAKLLVLTLGMQCSLHRHIRKDECFFVLEGRAVIRHGSDASALGTEGKDPGDCLRVPPGTWHTFWAASPFGALLLEVSSHHDDNDVERLFPSGPLEIF